ncbi:MAG TPA: PQQ-dependent sugar dehydrogenase [Actinomycetota bacterium]|nr:PQQ-dependent sugar dehydrogenase [Actinomycetota bacterium]
MRLLLVALALVLVAPAAPACAADHRGTTPPGGPTPAGSSHPAATKSVTPQRTPDGSATAAPRSRSQPALRVRRVVTGLDHPWDVKRLPGGTLLVTERDRARLSAYRDGARRTVRFPEESIWVSGETGLMSLEVDPDFADNRRFYTCSGWRTSRGGHDIRVVAWELDSEVTAATRVETLVAGFPTTSGRHGGCRLLIADNGALLVGTGDAAVGTNPHDLRSLGGKTLRLDPATGKPWPGNPFAKAHDENKRYVFTYGHRNVQGLAQRKDGTLWSVEHGSSRDDEVNRLRPGGDYGWHPVPGYDESVPMTDQSLPGRQIPARWSSGEPTLATSGATWVYGRRWGRLSGTLAVAALKASRLVFMKFDDRGQLEWTRSPKKLRQLGRLRSVTLTPDRSLLLTTDNDSGNDAILRVSPR